MKKKVFEVKKLDKDYTREDLEKVFESAGIPMSRSFPMVFDGSIYLGSLNEIKMAAARNTL
jgi:glutaredoxin